MEELDEVKSEEPINVIMNGWFMWHPEKFPPAPCINPLFVSFHIAPSIEKQFFTKETTQYLKKYEPIGTRDTETGNILGRHGIKHYLSGCLTLTLNKTYFQEVHDDSIYIVDPIIMYSQATSIVGKAFSYANHIFYLIRHLRKMRTLSKIFYHQQRSPLAKLCLSLDKMLETTVFYRRYSKCFTDEILFGATYLSQIVDNYKSVEDKFAMADERLRMYAKAKLVITRRIHAALPCLALKTPVVLTVNDDIISNQPKQKADGGRFGGIIDLFNYVKFSQSGISRVGVENMVGFENIPDNPNKYLEFQRMLDDKVQAFVDSVKKKRE
jgi:hypothetical protein